MGTAATIERLRLLGCGFGRRRSCFRFEGAKEELSEGIIRPIHDALQELPRVERGDTPGPSQGPKVLAELSNFADIVEGIRRLTNVDDAISRHTASFATAGFAPRGDAGSLGALHHRASGHANTAFFFRRKTSAHRHMGGCGRSAAA
jgi:hypothetical protein